MKKSAPRKFKMDFVQKVTLSPIEKYVLYNRFPWKLVVHVLLLVFTTYQALQMVNSRSAITRAEHMVLKNILMASTDDSDIISFFSLEDFSNHLKGMVDNLRNINDILIQEIDTERAEYKMNIYYREINQDNINRTVVDIDIDKNITEPFNFNDTSSMKEFLNDVSMFEFNGIGILNLIDFNQTAQNQSCMNWTFSIKYDLQSFANVQATLFTGVSNCFKQNSELKGQNLLLIHMIVIILACVGLALSWRHIYHTGAEYMHQRSMYRQVKDYVNQDPQPGDPQSNQLTPVHGPSTSPELMAQQYGLDFIQNWDTLGYIERISFFDMWFIISVFGNFVQIVGSVIAVIDCFADQDLSIFDFQEALVGLGCMVAWLMMLKYLEYNPNINLMTSTLRLASTNIIMFMLGIIPFFFGFVFLGQCIFWRFEKFSSTLNSIITLFALANGDIVSDTFMDTWSSGIIGQLFLVVFMILFFTAVQNVFITIIMEGFEENRKQKQLQTKKDQQSSPLKRPLQDLNNRTQTELIYQDETRVPLKDEESVRSPRSLRPALLMDVGEHQDDKEMVIGKLKLNTKRVERMLDEMDQLLDEIDKSRIKPDEKAYLLSVYRENVENISRNIKFQLSNISS